MSQILYGKNVIREILEADRRKVHELYAVSLKDIEDDARLAALAGKKGIRPQIVNRERLDKLTTGAKHQGVAARVDDFPFSSLPDLIAAHETHALFVMCDSIQDPQNLGAISRS